MIRAALGIRTAMPRQQASSASQRSAFIGDGKQTISAVLGFAEVWQDQADLLLHFGRSALGRNEPTEEPQKFRGVAQPLCHMRS
jgi:hypothetical protein